MGRFYQMKFFADEAQQAQNQLDGIEYFIDISTVVGLRTETNTLGYGPKLTRHIKIINDEHWTGVSEEDYLELRKLLVPHVI